MVAAFFSLRKMNLYLYWQLLLEESHALLKRNYKSCLGFFPPFFIYVLLEYCRETNLFSNQGKF